MKLSLILYIYSHWCVNYLCARLFLVLVVGQSLAEFIHPLVVGKRIPTPAGLKGCLVVEGTGIVDALFDILLEVSQETLDGPGAASRRAARASAA